MRKSANMSEQASHGLTRLDIAKMTVDAITKAMNHRIQSHNTYVTSYQEQQSGSASGFLEQIGRASLDHFLLISTGYQSKYLSDNQSNGSTSSSAIGNRILVDYGSLTELHTTFEGDTSHSPSHYQTYCAHLTQNNANFEKALKNLSLPKNVSITKDLSPAAKALDSFFPENGGGVHGLNAALSAGLQLMSRYRLHNRWTENFGLGRLPSTAIITHGGLGVYGSSSSSSTGFTSSVHQTTQALQPACLILLTDGECLNQPPESGGGTLELQYGNMPLREFYKERESISFQLDLML
jgi:integrator complex subunit 6